MQNSTCRNLWIVWFVLTLNVSLNAQMNFSARERLQGYAISGDTTFFVFDEALYGVQPQRVLLEGEMRSWDHNMEDPTWRMQRAKNDAKLWMLALANPAFARVKPGAQFKFRINEGIWLVVPESAPNEKGGNLIFAHEVVPTQVRAELVSARHVRVLITGEKVKLSLNAQDYRLTLADGTALPIAAVLRLSPKELHLRPTLPLDLKRVHFLEVLPLQQKVVASFEGYFRHLYSNKELGANYDAQQQHTMFRVFAPRATQVRLFLYDAPAGEAFQTVEMKPDEDGVWESAVAGNMEGKYYDFTVHGANDPGNYFFEQRPVHVNDPYARV
ncbi:pullulanase, partial [candidate division KSB1 bacterium]|nr:pullulanase [candidate division KSB1 bacterium]